MDLKVCLNSGRNYVQGTQIISRVAELVANEDVILSSAAFRSITNTNVSAIKLDGESQDFTESIGEIVFDGSSKLIFSIVRSEGLAKRMDLPVHCVWSRQRTSNCLEASYEISDVHTFEDMLIAIVQSVKEEHQMLGENVHNIWFTGLRKADFPISYPFPITTCILDIKRERIFGRGQFYQSMQTIKFDKYSAVLSFSFKSPEAIDAN